MILIPKVDILTRRIDDFVPEYVVSGTAAGDLSIYTLMVQNVSNTFQYHEYDGSDALQIWNTGLAVLELHIKKIQTNIIHWLYSNIVVIF